MLLLKVYDLLQISLVIFSYRKGMGSLQGIFPPGGPIGEAVHGIPAGNEPGGVATILTKCLLEGICWVLCQKVGTQQ